VLPDTALRSIADNLTRLRLDPVLHLKIAVAVVAPLMRDDGIPASRAIGSGPNPPNLSNARRKVAATRAHKRKGRPEPIPIVYNGKIFPSRGAMAKHLAAAVGKSPTTLARALLDAGDDAEAVVLRR
jgi:hypothetical protein